MSALSQEPYTRGNLGLVGRRGPRKSERQQHFNEVCCVDRLPLLNDPIQFTSLLVCQAPRSCEELRLRELGPWILACPGPASAAPSSLGPPSPISSADGITVRRHSQRLYRQHRPISDIDQAQPNFTKGSLTWPRTEASSDRWLPSKGQTCLPLNPGVIKSVPAGRLSFSASLGKISRGGRLGAN